MQRISLIGSMLREYGVQQVMFVFTMNFGEDQAGSDLSLKLLCWTISLKSAFKIFSYCLTLYRAFIESFKKYQHDEREEHGDVSASTADKNSRTGMLGAGDVHGFEYLVPTFHL